MKTKHTPGPWELLRSPLKNDPYLYQVAKGDKWIANISRYLEGHEANARLIAAAPELLEAAKFAIQICKGSMDPAATDCSLKLKAAIQKATQP